MAKADDYLENVLAVVPGHIYWKNLKGEFLGCNNSQALDAGFSCREDIVGLTDYDMPWKDDAESLREADACVISGGMAVISEEGSRLYDGRERVWLSRKEPLRDKKGKIIGIIGTSIDITDQKQAEQLKQKNLEQQIAIEVYQNFKNCLDDIQNTIQTYKFGILNSKLGITATNLPHAEIVLTKRESEILYYISLNKSPKEIAGILSIIDQKDIASTTIQAIINKQLYPKFGVYNVSQLVERANTLRLIPFTPDY